MSFHLVAYVSGTRRPVSYGAARDAIAEHFLASDGHASVHRFWPADFLVVFDSRARHDGVLNAGAGVLDAADFSLHFSPWNRQLQGNRRVFSYRVNAEVVGVPAISWSLATAKTIFGSSAWMERLGTETGSRADMGNFRVTVWTDDPARLPRSKQLWLAKPLEFDEEDEDLLLPVAALVPQEVALLEFNATIHLMRVEDVGAGGDRHPLGEDRRDHGDAGAGGVVAYSTVLRRRDPHGGEKK